jgi:hypothetical protein
MSRINGVTGWLVLAAGWLAVAACEGGRGRCQGDTPECPLRSKPANCTAGCSLVPGCTVVSCPKFESEVECRAVPACKWSTSGGCLWLDNPCPAGVSEAACMTDPSCVWGEVCTGTPLPCKSFEDEDSCDAAPNCAWYVSPAL